MPTPPVDTALKPLEFHSSADFEQLLDIARDHIRDLAGRIWTDHNSHDPGITILEVLCFAIADLSYRTSFDVKDLIAGYTGEKDLPIDLPLADVALPNHPFTVKDLRKVLLDLKDPSNTTSGKDKLLLRNAWPVVATESEVDSYLIAPGKNRGMLTLLPNVLPTSPVEEKEKEKGIKEIERQTPKDNLPSNAANLPSPVPSPAPSPNMPFDPGMTGDPNMPFDPGMTGDPNMPFDPGMTGDPNMPFDPGMTGDPNMPLPPRPPENPSKDTTLPRNPHTQAVKTPNETTKLPTRPLPRGPGGSGQVPTRVGSSLNRNIRPDKDRKRLQLNGLYGLQLEFEEERLDLTTPYYLADLNKNYFRTQVQVQGKSYELSVLFPYWDQVNWSLKDVDLNQSQLAYSLLKDSQDPYFIGVDKLNYDDHFYDYFAEVLLNDHLLAAFINITTPIRSFIEVNGQQYHFEIKWMDWNELANGVRMDYNLVNRTSLAVDYVGTDALDPVYDIQVKFEKPGKVYPLLARIIFDAGQALPDHYTVADKLKQKFDALYQLRIALESAIRTELINRQSSLYQDYLIKLQTVFRLVYGTEGVWESLGDYRNLCEDFASFSASRVQEIALFGKILLKPGYNPNQVLGEACFQIDQFLHPLVKFHTLDEISAKGYSFDEIFNGPLLEHGFIEDKDLENLKRRSVIYTSDLIRILMDVEGVEAVENFSISSYIDNRLMGRKVTNCLSLTYADVYRPRLSMPKSGLELCSGAVRETVDIQQAIAWYNRRLQELQQTQLPAKPSYSLELPKGISRETSVYHSIQNDFPQIYGIGPFGLPEDSSPARKARAKQLKAYLLPFEQILANYLKQISHLPELFSFNSSIESTYSHTPLYEVPAVAPLFKPFLQSGGTWDSFKADLGNAYRTKLKENESEAIWLNRRNRFLDHLLGRFAEGFGKYAQQLFNQHKGLLDPLQPQQMGLYQQKRQAEMQRLIGDKIAFAADFPQVSMQRSRAFNYQLTAQSAGGWNSENVSGYKRRICRLLGLGITGHVNLFNQPDPDKPGDLTDLEGLHVVEHILLRPRHYAASLLPVVNETDGKKFFIYDSERDPYSFRLTVVLPSFAGRFKDPQFRQFAENLIREETPAHILVNIQWMSGRCGAKFEFAFSEWLGHTYHLKPYLLQNILTENDAAQMRQNPDLQAYFIAETRLVIALQARCDLSLEAYDKGRRLLHQVHGMLNFPIPQQDIHFLQVSEPKGKLEIFYRLNANKDWKQVAFLENVKDNWVPVSDLTRNPDAGLAGGLKGKGQYKINYVLGNEVETLILLAYPGKIEVPLSIRISDLENPDDIAAPDRSGRIVLNSRQVMLRLNFHPIGGTMRIFAGNTYPAAKVSPLVEQTNVESFDFDIRNYLPFEQHKLFRLIYEFEGKSISYLLDYQGKIIPKATKLSLFANKVPVNDFPVLIDPKDDSIVWNFGFQPLDGMLYFYQIINGERQFFGREAVTEQNRKQELEVQNIWKMKGVGQYEVEYVTPGGKANIYFELQVKEEVPVWPYKTKVAVLAMPGKKLVEEKKGSRELRFNFQSPDMTFDFLFQDGPGQLELDDGGKIHLVRKSAELFSFSAAELPSGNYKVKYTPEAGEPLVFVVKVMNIDPRFKLVKVEHLETQIFRVYPLPLRYSGRTYVWRVNDKYTSRSKKPKIKLDFSKHEAIELQLGVFDKGKHEIFEMMLTAGQLLEMTGEND